MNEEPDDLSFVFKADLKPAAGHELFEISEELGEDDKRIIEQLVDEIDTFWLTLECQLTKQEIMRFEAIKLVGGVKTRAGYDFIKEIHTRFKIHDKYWGARFTEK